MTDHANLYAQHVSEKMRRFQAILAATGFDEIVIAAGDSKIQFADDSAYPFIPNPYFREWVPLGKRTGSYLQISANSDTPRLFFTLRGRYLAHRPSGLAAGF